MRSGRRKAAGILPLVLSLGLVLTIAAAGVSAAVGGEHKSAEVLRADRLDKTTTIAGLADQYMMFTVKEVAEAADGLSLRPGDPADAAKLRALITRSALLNFGAALVTPKLQVLNAYAPAGLPPLSDPGFVPLIAGLLSGKPGLSSVMKVGNAPVVAVGVPSPPSDPDPRAILVAFFRVDQSPLQTYNTRLHYGRRGVGYLLDSTGTVVTATRPEDVGRKLASSLALDRLRARDTGVLEVKGMVTGFAPLSLGGWGTLNEEPAGDFFGPVRSGSLRVTVALVALLVVAAAGMFLLNQRRQDALARAYEYKGELLANTTHELKTPLTAIRGASMTLGLRWREMTQEQIDTFLGIVHRRCEGLQKLVDRILTGARLEAGREVPIQPEPVHVAGVLTRMATEFGDASPRHAIVAAVPPHLWTESDPVALDQVLGLLIENAIKYSPEGGRVRIDAIESEGRIVFGVADQGIGMDPEDVAHVFDAYFKAQRGDRNSYGGVGLGLSIARHLVRRHGGDIWVASAPGKGSTFSFSMPACSQPDTRPIESLVEVGG